MSIPIIPADELFQTIASSSSHNETKIQLIMQLKTHVKKDFVDIKEVPRYLEALSIAVDIPESNISSVSFSLLCHLVKRVSMQDKSGEVLKSQGFLILPIIINRLGDSKSSTLNSARKALEAYWLSAPNEVERCLIDIAFKHRNTRIVSESVKWLHFIISNINPNFKLGGILPHLVKLLNVSPNKNSDSSDLLDNTIKLLSTYYQLKQNKIYRYDLNHELEVNSVPQPIRDSILPNSKSINEKSHKSQIDSNFIIAGKTKVTVNKNAHQGSSENSLPRAYQNSEESPMTAQNIRTDSQMSVVESDNEDGHNNNTSSDSNYSMDVEISPELEKIVSTLNFTIDSSINAMSIPSVDNLYSVFNEVLIPFHSKETEFNWAAREKNIIRMRSIIRGNSVNDFKSDLVICFKDVSESVCKALTSLRTTLCQHACNLMKELSIIFKVDIDSLVDLYLPTLIQLCSATKNITSTNAHAAICSIFINTTYNHKLLQRILATAGKKVVSPRSFSGIWLQIFLIRCSNDQGFLSSPAIETSKKIIIKILGDANPTVRQVAKDTYWCFWSKFPSEAEAILLSLDTNVVRAIERSKPKDVNSGYEKSKIMSNITQKKVRPSIKQSIIARNKELRSKKMERSITPRPASRGASESSIVTETRSLDKSKVGGHIFPKRSLTTSLSKPESVKQSSSDISKVSLVNSRSITPKLERDSSFKKEDVKRNSDQLMDATFDKQGDPILKFLSSNQTDLVLDGVNLLKYAIMGEEDLASEINGLLKKISVRQPTLLQPLFLTTDNLFKKSYQFFLPEDFFRICSILINPVNERNVDLMISVIPIDDIFDSIIKLLSYTINVSNIIDDDELTMQIIMYKTTIIQMIISFLDIGLNKVPISDTYFLKLASNMFELSNLLKSTDIYASYTNLLAKLYSINASLFSSELELTDRMTKEEVEFVVGIDGTLSLSKPMNTSANQFSSLFELTKVNPIKGLDNFSPVKVNADFTMLMPVLKDNDSYTYIPQKKEEKFNEQNGNKVNKCSPNIEKIKFNLDEEPHFDSYVEDNIDIDGMDVDKKIEDFNLSIHGDQIAKDEVLQNKTDNQSNLGTLPVSNTERKSLNDDIHNDDSIFSAEDDENDNIFRDETKARVSSGLYNKLNKLDNAIELAEDFSQVKITELNKNSINPIEYYIEKTDPLNRISNRNKTITIYEDEKKNGSPQKVKEYNYADPNWFNYQISKHFTDNASSNDNTSIEEFESLCNDLSTRNIVGDQFLSLLNILQSLDKNSSEFRNYYEFKGQSIFEISLWKFFEDYVHLRSSHILSGLILVKQILINKYRMDMKKLWYLLVGLYDSTSHSNEELSHAIEETYDEMLCGVFSTKSILVMVLQTLAEKDDLFFRSIYFSLECLSKLLAINSITLVLDDELVLAIDENISCFINNEMVEIRKSVISSYGKLLHISKLSNSLNFQTEKTSDIATMDEIMNKFTIPQKKLIEYYSNV